MELVGGGETADLLLGRDLGMAQTAAVRENELYTAQYLAYSVFASAGGPVICFFNREKLDRLYPGRCFEEMCNGQLMSFFTTVHAHVVLA